MKINKKLLLIILVLGIIIPLALIFAPFIFLKSYVNSQFEGVDKSKTKIINFHLINPKLTVYTIDSAYDSSVYFVEAKRNILIFWKIENTSFKKVYSSAYLSEEEQSKEAQENLEALQKSVNSGSLTTGDDQNYSEIISNDGKEETLFTVYSSDEKNKLDLIRNPDGSVTLDLNGNQIQGLINVSSPVFSFEDDYIYYSKFKAVEVEGDWENYSGKIYRYNLETGNEELIYSFGSSEYMNISANSDYVVYSLGSGETGVIDLESREKTVLNVFEMFPSSDPC